MAKLEKIIAFFRILGVLLVSFGLVRDAFGDIVLQRGFAEGRFSDNPVGHFMAAAQNTILQVGVRSGMLSVQQPLNMFDRRLDAEMALLGFFMLVIAGIVTLVIKSAERR